MAANASRLPGPEDNPAKYGRAPNPAIPETETDGTSVLRSSPPPLTPALSGEVLPPHPAAKYTPPEGILDLIWRMWLTLEWSRTRQVMALLFTAAVLFAGLGIAAHAIFGVPTLWTAIGGAATGMGLGGAGAYSMIKHRSKPSDQEADVNRPSEGGDAEEPQSRQ